MNSISIPNSIAALVLIAFSLMFTEVHAATNYSEQIDVLYTELDSTLDADVAAVIQEEINVLSAEWEISLEQEVASKTLEQATCPLTVVEDVDGNPKWVCVK